MKQHILLAAGLIFTSATVIVQGAAGSTQQGTSALVQKGLVLDLNADRGIEAVEGDRVSKWTNQADFRAKEFIATRDGSHAKGTGHPRWKKNVAALGGHNTVSFKREELINLDEDAFDHLTTGSGYTWFLVMSVYPQVPVLKDVNAIFGNLRNGGNFEGFWAGLKDDNTLWMGSRNGITFGRWDENNPQVLGPKLAEGRFYVVAGRMAAGTGQALVELFVDSAEPKASRPIKVNPKGNPSKMAIGQERDAVQHPGGESFDGELARVLMYDRALTDEELRQTVARLREEYQLP